MTNDIKILMDNQNNIFSVLRKNSYFYIGLIASLSVLAIRRIDFTVLLMMNPRQVTLMDMSTKSLKCFTYPKDSISIYQTRCSSKEELIHFILACIRLKKICDSVKCKLYIILRKPIQMKEQEFLDVLNSEIPQYCEQLNLHEAFASLELMYDFNNNLDTPEITSQGISAVVMHRNGRKVAVSSCSTVFVKPFHEQEQIVFGPDMPDMIEHATNGGLKEFLLNESNDPKTNYIKKLIAQCGEPSN